MDHRVEALETERAQLADALLALRRELGAADDALEIARAEAARFGEAREAARSAALAARERDGAARAELFRADEALAALEGKVHALEGLERERVGLAPAAARLLREREQFGDGAIVGPVSDFVTATSNAASAVERFLGATVHAIVVRDADVANAVRTWHAQQNPGPLLLLPLDAQPVEAPVAGTLADEVETSGAGAQWAKALLSGVKASADLTSFVDARGAVWLPGTSAGPGPLRRRAELFALRAEMSVADARRKETDAAAQLEREALAAAEAASVTADDEATRALGEARRGAEGREELVRRGQRAEREVEEAGALADRLRGRRGELAARVESIATQSATLATTLAEREQALAHTRESLGAAERAQDHAREQRTASQVAQAQAQARLQVALDRERRLAEEQTSAESRLESLQAELSSLSEADSQLAEQVANWQLDLEQRRATLADADQRLSDSELAVSTADASLTDAEHALDEVRRAGVALADELHQGELRLTELSGRRAAIKERLETEWRRPLHELLSSFTPVEVDDLTLRQEAESLRDQIEGLGPVNPLAIEEHEEEVRRLDFLTTQRQDLADAKNALQQAIREIDTTARELFLATFAQVRENFRQIFMTLFGGGECDLRLENPEIPLDCDIEIHASPRGKRTQRIHLLSSGERALVALSLLFGIFLTKPSPFCLLDEVDAPLDDQNIGRFVRMLNQFKERTQFIVITHNPRTTTEAADAVYGVTMQEPGVSSVVSVRLRGNSVEEAIAGRVESREPVTV